MQNSAIDGNVNRNLNFVSNFQSKHCRVFPCEMLGFSWDAECLFAGNDDEKTIYYLLVDTSLRCHVNECLQYMQYQFVISFSKYLQHDDEFSAYIVPRQIWLMHYVHFTLCIIIFTPFWAWVICSCWVLFYFHFLVELSTFCNTNSNVEIYASGNPTRRDKIPGELFWQHRVQDERKFFMFASQKS